MNIEILDDDEVEQKPTLLGRCHVLLGGGCGKAIFSDDLEALELGVNYRGERYGIICATCLNALFNSRPWSGGPGTETQRAAGRNAKAHGQGISLPGSPEALERARKKGPTPLNAEQGHRRRA